MRESVSYRNLFQTTSNCYSNTSHTDAVHNRTHTFYKAKYNTALYGKANNSVDFPCTSVLIQIPRYAVSICSGSFMYDSGVYIDTKWRRKERDRY